MASEASKRASCDRFLAFQENAASDRSEWSPREIARLLERYLALESSHFVPKLYSSKASGEEISGSERDYVIRWLSVMSNTLRFSPETLFLAAHLLDDFLHLVKAKPRYLKCIGITCFYLAAKMIEENESVPSMSDLIALSGCECSVSELLRMERVVIDKLKWDLQRATAIQFVHAFHALLLHNCRGLLPDHLATSLRQLGPLLETKAQICLSQRQLLLYRPSALALALISLELEPWTQSWFIATVALQRVANISHNDVIACREALTRAFASFSLRVPSTAAANAIYNPRSGESVPPILGKEASTSQANNHNRAPAASARKVSVSSRNKRKMDVADIEEIYDSIKKLYGDEASAA